MPSSPPPLEPIDLPNDYSQRFGGIARLYGDQALNAFYQAHIAIIGLGGIGSWVAEALARTGIGALTLIELDDICITNTNRQLHTLHHTIGQQKNATLCKRLKNINPSIILNSHEDFLTKNNISQYITSSHHVVIDAIDSSAVKAALAAHCSWHKQRLIMAGSSGGKTNPTNITVSDLSQTVADPMLAKVRNLLHRHHNFERNKKRKYRIDAVYSTEHRVYPQPDGSVCNNKKNLQQEESTKLDCASGFGSASMVTGSFGFTMAAKAVERYLQDHFPS